MATTPPNQHPRLFALALALWDGVAAVVLGCRGAYAAAWHSTDPALTFALVNALPLLVAAGAGSVAVLAVAGSVAPAWSPLARRAGLVVHVSAPLLLLPGRRHDGARRE